MKLRIVRNSWEFIALSDIQDEKNEGDNIFYGLDVIGWNKGQKQEDGDIILRVIAVLLESGDEYDLTIESKFYFEDKYITNRVLKYRDDASALLVDKVTEYIEST